MRLSDLWNPWQRVSALERENRRLRDCLEYEEQRNFDYMFHRMNEERRRYAQMEAMNAQLLKTAVDLSNLNPSLTAFVKGRKP